MIKNEDFSHQREQILSLLKNKYFVPTTELSKIASQYNSRVFELRRQGNDILSVNQDGVFGFRLEKSKENTEFKETKHCFNCPKYRAIEGKNRGSCQVYFINVFAADRCVEVKP